MPDSVKAIAYKAVRDVHAAFEGGYGQAKNTVAWRRTLAEVLEGGALPEPGTTEHATVLAVGFFFGNASAVRQAVLESKASPDKLAEDYSDIA